MSDDAGITVASRRLRKIGALLVSAVVVSAGSVAAGFWWGRPSSAVVTPSVSPSPSIDWAEAGQDARRKCRDDVGSRLRRTVPEAIPGDWQDVHLAGIDERGSPAARVDGTVRANRADGTFELHHYDCSLSGYDAHLHTWSLVTTSGGKVGS